MAAVESEVQQNQQLTPTHDYHFTGNDYTVERKCKFIEGLTQTHTVYRAAQIAGISKKTAYNWYVDDAQFAEAWEEALGSATEDLETCMFERAKAKDTLAGIFLLKKYNPEFRDRVTIDVSLVQEQIDSMIGKLDAVQRQQLPAAMTEFIDTDYSESTQEYQSQSMQPESMQFSPTSDNQQKEESPSDLSDSHS